MNDDLYAVLGVLPDAEEVVIKAAYRALAQRYHPDHWGGDAAVAHQRMALVNKAYEVLGDKAQRDAYDMGRVRSQTEYAPEEEDDKSDAFSSALKEVDARWATACSIFPDLVGLRASLARVNTSLAFTFVTSLLGSKGFNNREAFAAHLEQSFLERHFGTNKRILVFVRALIVRGNRAAVKELNQLVDVMGSDIDPNLLIQEIERKFRSQWDQAKIDEELRRKAVFLKSGDFLSACLLAESHGYKVAKVGQGILMPMGYRVLKNNVEQTFPTKSEFTAWVKSTWCCD